MKPDILVYAVVTMIGVALAGFIGFTLNHAFTQLGQIVAQFRF